MANDLEDLAVSLAAYSRLHWRELSKAGRDHYLRLAQFELERKAYYDRVREPPTIKNLGRW